MVPIASHWGAPPLTTSDVDAATDYRDGIAALVAGTPHSTWLLARALERDPGFLLAAVDLRLGRLLAGEPLDPLVVPAAAAGRAERQHAEVVLAILRGDRTRAADLRREHLLEFPGDVLIVWLPATAAWRGSDQT